MFILKASLLVVLIINVDASAICQSYIFSSLANKFPKRFNSLFELRILVQNSLKNMYFLTIKLI
jgi:hypothetical protein